jgi:DNA-binding beta-propeller fold protein YncE
MKMKVLFIVSLLALVTTGAFAVWTYVSGIGSTGESGQFCDTDNGPPAPKGKLWITNYGTPSLLTPPSYVAVVDLLTDLVTIITSGKKNDGSPGSFFQAGGVAYDPMEDMIYCISRDADTVITGNQVYMLKFDPATLNPFPGCDLTALGFDNPGDIDVFTSGSLSYVVIVNKLDSQWGIFNPRLPAPPWLALPGNPWGTVTGWHINRGISCTPDGSMVLVADTDGNAVVRWDRQLNCSYVKNVVNFETGSASGESACEMDDYIGGNLHVLVSQTGKNKLIIMKAADGSVLDSIENVPGAQWELPRGASYSNDNANLYVVQFTGNKQMVAKFGVQTIVGDWIKY